MRHVPVIQARFSGHPREFSFILITLSAEHKLVPPEAESPVVAAAIVSIAMNPLLSAWATRAYRARTDADVADFEPVETTATGHVILVGHGRIGARVARGLWKRAVPVVLIDDDETRVEAIRALAAWLWA